MDSTPQKLLENAVEQLHLLPGIGRKTAMRMALFLLTQSEETVEKFANGILDFRKNIKYCRICHNISETDICPICSSPKRDATRICVVSDVRDVMAIENTGLYNGLYHVLGGLISPMTGVSPAQLTIDALVKRVENKKPEELILALPATPEGDTTGFYTARLLKNSGIKITTLAKGIAVGNDLEYTDEVTLGRSLTQRIDFIL